MIDIFEKIGWKSKNLLRWNFVKYTYFGNYKSITRFLWNGYPLCSAGVDLGGGSGGGYALLSGVRSRADSKGPPFGTFKKSSFGQPTLKFF